jgi:RNA polymerase sigma factor (sigma-70 family)
MAEETWLDEQALIQGLRARDPISLEALINQYSRELFYFARLILAGAGSAQDAEECLSDLFIAVWQEFESFDPARGSLRTWLTMRTKYIALDCRRLLLRQQFAGLPTVPLEYTLVLDQRPPDTIKHRQAVQMQPMTVGVDVLLEQQERREELGRALERLPEFDRLIVYLRYFQFAGIREIAARTGLTKHAIEARLWRARKVLRQALQEPTSHTLGQRRQRALGRTPLRIKRRSEEELSAIVSLQRS